MLLAGCGQGRLWAEMTRNKSWMRSRRWQELSTEQVELCGGALEILRLGQPGGTPLLFFHGWPSSLCQAMPWDQPAREAGFELISVNRPGIGRSTPRPGMRIADWPTVTAQLLEALGLERAGAVGVSGGAPFALACGALAPEHFPQISVICGAPPLGGDYQPWRADMAKVYQLLGGWVEKHPKTMERMMRVSAPALGLRSPRWVYQLGSRGLCAGDREVVSSRELAEWSIGSFQGAMRSGGRSVLEEGQRYLGDWGFRLDEVRVPVSVWHGAGDRNFSWTLAQRVAESLPQGKLELREDDGHYSIAVRRVPEVLADLRWRWDQAAAHESGNDGSGCDLPSPRDRD